MVGALVPQFCVIVAGFVSDGRAEQRVREAMRRARCAGDADLHFTTGKLRSSTVQFTNLTSFP
jgi:hypothetical protein